MKVASLIDTRIPPTEHAVTRIDHGTETWKLSCSYCLPNQLQFHEVSSQHAPLHSPLLYSILWAGYLYNPQTRGWGPQYTLDQTGVRLVSLYEIGQKWNEQTQHQDTGNIKKNHFANDEKVEVFNRCVLSKLL